MCCRFEIQASENKRLQSAIATLKSDSNQTKRKLVSNLPVLIYFLYRDLQHIIISAMYSSS